MSYSRISFLRPYRRKMLKFFNFFSFSLSHSLVCRAAYAFLLPKLSSLFLSLSPSSTQASSQTIMRQHIYIPHLSFTFPLFSKSLWAIYFNSCLSENFILSLFLSLANGCGPTMVVLRWWLWVVGHGLMIQWLWSNEVIWFYGSGFVGLSSWVWVCGSRFVGLGSWIIKLTNVDHQLDQRG